MAKKKGRRNNGSGSSSFNARAKAHRENARNEPYYYDDYSDDDDYHSRFDHRHSHYHSYHDDYESRRSYSRPEGPVHDHSGGANLCPLCSEKVVLFLSVVQLEDKQWMDDHLFALHWSIYGGFIAAIALYHPSNIARDSSAHWLIRWPWIISWHCMVVCLFSGLFLKYYFVKPFKKIVYDNVYSRTLLDTIELRHKLLTQLEEYHVKKLCRGVVWLFLIGIALAAAGVMTLVLSRSGTALHGSWSTAKYIILLLLRFAKWVLRGVVLRLKSVIRLADRVGRATGRNTTKSGTLLLAFAKLYGRTFAKFSRSLVVFMIDLAKLLFLTAVAVVILALFALIYNVARGSRLDEDSNKHPNNVHAAHDSPKDAPSSRPFNTSPPVYESPNADLPAGNPGKKDKPRRKKA